MKQVLLIIATLITFFGFAQKKDLALKKSNNYVYEGNELVENDFVSAEMEYRKALSQKPNNVAGSFNLANAYYKNDKFSEAVMRQLETIQSATSKEEKHKAYHNLGNAYMLTKQCKEAVEAFKNALRNNPNDDETRYNLALAKECAKEQGGGGGGEDENQEDKDDQQQQEQQENQDQNQNQDQQQQDDQQKDNQDQNQDKQEGDQEQDEKGKPDEKEQEQGQGDKQEKRQPKQQQGKLSPQQIKNLLEAMNDHEEKVQDKINAQKVEGGRVQTDKDW